MIVHTINKLPIQKSAHTGSGIINSIINKLPFELHLPGYQYCGPGTKLQKRLLRGDQGVNELDKACKEHDIAYSQKKDTFDRNIADTILAEKAWSRVKSADSNLAEKASALLVTNIMKAKTKFGMGMKESKTKKCGGKLKKQNVFRKAVRKARDFIKKKKPIDLKAAIKIGINAAKIITKKKHDAVQLPRIIPIPKTGGVLPFLIPLFAGLSAVGALSGGITGIAKAVSSAQNAKKGLEEATRHNKTMESIALGKGLHLQPYRKGLGLYLQPHQKNV